MPDGTTHAAPYQSPEGHTQRTSAQQPGNAREPVTLRTLQRMAIAGEPFACLAAYDATTASYLERAGIHLLLMGDSAAQVILGHDSTIHMPFEVTVHLTAALKRGAPTCHVMADMPFGSYGVSRPETTRNAMRLMTEGRADSVKLELTARGRSIVRALTNAGVPVCAHVGLKPSQVGLSGTYRAQGRTADKARQVLHDAESLAHAGAVMILVEAVPPEVAEMIVERVDVPVIGIGSGTAPHGQILVSHDMLGLSPRPPRFATPAGALAAPLLDAARTWVRRVADRDIGGEAYTMPADEAASFRNDPDGLNTTA